MLTVFADRSPVVGTPPKRLDGAEQRLELFGFADRVGDPVGIVAADGSRHRAENLLTQALQVLLSEIAVSIDDSVLAASVPAHWSPTAVRALRDTVAEVPELSVHGRTMPLLSDDHTTLTAMAADPGLPDRGVLVLCDLGGTGTSITLVDAANDFERVGSTVRHAAFCGDEIDQALLTQVLADNVDTADLDPTGTATIAALTDLRVLCRSAKERLSADTVTTLSADMPALHGVIRLTRSELENRIREPLDCLVSTIRGVLDRAGIHPANIAAVATAGGVAAMPLITQVLSEAFKAPVIRAAKPQFAAAVGAAHEAVREDASGADTAMQPAAALAWSEDDSSPDVLPLADGAEDVGDSAARPQFEFGHDDEDEDDDRRRAALVPWYRRPGVLLGAAAIAAAASAGGYYMTTVREVSNVVPSTAPLTAPTVPAAEQQVTFAPAETAPGPQLPEAPQQAPLLPPVQQPTVRRVPAQQPPVQLPPARQLPPVQQAPPQEAPPQLPPVQQAPPQQAPPQQAPPQQAPVQQAPPQQPAADQPPAQQPANQLAPAEPQPPWQLGDPVPLPALPPIPGVTDRPDIPGPFQ